MSSAEKENYFGCVTATPLKTPQSGSKGSEGIEVFSPRDSNFPASGNDPPGPTKARGYDGSATPEEDDGCAEIERKLRDQVSLSSAEFLQLSHYGFL